MTAAVEVREGYAPVAGGRIWYRTVGGGGAIPLVTVHSGPGGIHDYLAPLEALADERPLVFYGQLGGGKSDALDDVSLWTNERMIDELGRLLDPLELGRVHLLGHSWGTIIAAEYAVRSPDRLVSLVLSNPCLSVPRLAAGNLVLRAGLPADVRAVLDRHEAAGTTDSAEYETASMEFNRRHMCRLDPWPETMMRLFAELNYTMYEHTWGPNEFTVTGTHKDYDATEYLAELAMPTRFLCGRHDDAAGSDIFLTSASYPVPSWSSSNKAATCRIWRNPSATSRCTRLPAPRGRNIVSGADLGQNSAVSNVLLVPYDSGCRAVRDGCWTASPRRRRSTGAAQREASGRRDRCGVGVGGGALGFDPERQGNSGSRRRTSYQESVPQLSTAGQHGGYL